jgi:hypothetical protein
MWRRMWAAFLAVETCCPRINLICCLRVRPTTAVMSHM